MNNPHNREPPTQLGAATGRAVVWRAVQHSGVRFISLIRFFVLARILVPGDFGLLSIAAVSVDLLLSVTDFGMIPALVQRDRVERRHYDTAWTWNLTRAVMIGGATFAAAPLLAELFGEPRATPVIQVLALRPMLDAAGSIRVADLTRTLRFRSIAAIRLSAAIVEALVSIGLATRLAIWALVLGALTGTVVGSAMSYIVAPYRPHFSFDASAARPLIRFGRWIFVAGLLSVTADALLRAVISRRLGAADLGLYYVATRIAMLPNEVFSDLVGSIAFPVQALLQGDRLRATRVFRSTLRTTLAMLIVVYGVLGALAGSVVEHLLGSQWEGAAPVIRLLGVAGVIGAIFDATAPMLHGVGRSQSVAALFGVQLPIVVLLAWWLAGRYGVAGAAMAWLAAEVAVQMTAAVFATRLLSRPFMGCALPLVAIGTAGAAGAASAAAIDGILPGVYGLTVGTMGGLGVATGVLLVLDRLFGVGLLSDAAKAFPKARLPVVLSREREETGP